MMNIERWNKELPSDRDGLLMWAYLIYGLHLLSAISGILTPAFVVTAFLTGWPSIIAVALNYFKRGETRGSYLETHFRWQIRTFWIALCWFVLAGIFSITVIGIPIAVMIAWIAGLWVLYRIIRGGMRLMDGLPMPND